MAAKIKDCPFCGSAADEEVIIDCGDLSKVFCINPECGAEISMVSNLLRTRQLWNRRQEIKEAGITDKQQLQAKIAVGIINKVLESQCNISVHQRVDILNEVQRQLSAMQ